MEQKKPKTGILLLVVSLLALACSSTAYTPATETETSAMQKTIRLISTETAIPSICIVTAVEALNLRATPGTNAAVIDTLKQGDQLTILPQPVQGIWIQVRAGGLTGWINSNYCKGK